MGEDEMVVIRYVRRIWLRGRQSRAGIDAVPDCAGSAGGVADSWCLVASGSGGAETAAS